MSEVSLFFLFLGGGGGGGGGGLEHGREGEALSKSSPCLVTKFQSCSTWRLLSSFRSNFITSNLPITTCTQNDKGSMPHALVPFLCGRRKMFGENYRTNIYQKVHILQFKQQATQISEARPYPQMCSMDWIQGELHDEKQQGGFAKRISVRFLERSSWAFGQYGIYGIYMHYSLQYRNYRTGRNLTRTFPKIVPKFIWQNLPNVYITLYLFLVVTSPCCFARVQALLRSPREFQEWCHSSASRWEDSWWFAGQHPTCPGMPTARNPKKMQVMVRD